MIGTPGRGSTTAAFAAVGALALSCGIAACGSSGGSSRGYSDCLTFLVPGGITKVSYNGTTDYIDSPVTWAPN